MNLQQVMNQKSFAILGDTLNEEKFASKIKIAMENAGYRVYGVGQELTSLNEIGEEIDIVDLCIRPQKGLALLKENRKPMKAVVIQPGAGDDTLLSWLQENGIPYLEGCLLKGLSQFKKA